MVFSSIPAYLDPSNWHQQQTQQHHQVIGSGSGSGNGNGNGNPLLPPHVGPGSIRPGSMAERARMANIPLPEPALKCPRCDSTNTKFCYFNNYSLSQPRHFCKTCRRYWTRGGALRTVPVGGGCRRNKRTKSSSTSSKSPAASTPPPAASTPPPTTTTTTYVNNSYNNILGLPPMRFASQFNEGFSGLSGYNNGISMNNFVQGNFLEGDNGGGNINIIEPWRMQQQFPNFMEPSPTSQFHVGESSFVQRSRFSSSILGQEQAAGSVKMEERHPPPPPHPQEVNLSTRQLMLGGLMAPAGNEPWSNNNNNNNATNAPSWTELASFSSSSTSNPL